MSRFFFRRLEILGESLPPPEDPTKKILDAKEKEEKKKRKKEKEEKSGFWSPSEDRPASLPFSYALLHGYMAAFQIS